MIIIDDNIPLLAETLSTYDTVLTLPHTAISNALLVEQSCTALFVRSTLRVTEDLLHNTPVAFVGTATSGIDHIDSAYLHGKNIVFADGGGSNAHSVAEYVLFAITHWALRTQSDITEQTIGIIGYGHVGKFVAQYAKGLGMSVLVNDPPLRHAKFSFPPEIVDEYCNLEALLTNADIVTNHVPLTTDGNYPTRNLLGVDELDFLQEESLFIHTSRGGVVNEQVLLHDASAKNISLVLDVWENEPHFHATLASNALLATPHIAGHSYDAKLLGSLQMAQSYAQYAGIPVNTDLIEKALQHPRKRLAEFASLNDLYRTLTAARDIQEDSLRFKALTSLDEEQRAKAFAYLRRNYPERRESISVGTNHP